MADEQTNVVPVWTLTTQEVGVRDFVFRSGEVDELLRTSYKLRMLGEEVADSSSRDATIKTLRGSDGSVGVFPAIAAWSP